MILRVPFPSLLCSVLGILAGLVSAARQYGLADKAITFVVLIGISVPSFFLGMMMILLFAVQLRWFPVSGMWPIYGERDIWALLDHLVMPALALSVVATGVIARLARSAMLEVLRQDYIRTARAKGVHERRVIRAHALKAADGVDPPRCWVIQGGLSLHRYRARSISQSVFQWAGVGRDCWSTAISTRDCLWCRGRSVRGGLLRRFQHRVWDAVHVPARSRIKEHEPVSKLLFRNASPGWAAAGAGAHTFWLACLGAFGDAAACRPCSRPIWSCHAANRLPAAPYAPGIYLLGTAILVWDPALCPANLGSLPRTRLVAWCPLVRGRRPG